MSPLQSGVSSGLFLPPPPGAVEEPPGRAAPAVSRASPAPDPDTAAATSTGRAAAPPEEDEPGAMAAEEEEDDEEEEAGVAAGGTAGCGGRLPDMPRPGRAGRRGLSASPYARRKIKFLQRKKWGRKKEKKKEKLKNPQSKKKNKKNNQNGSSGAALVQALLTGEQRGRACAGRCCAPEGRGGAGPGRAALPSRSGRSWGRGVGGFPSHSCGHGIGSRLGAVGAGEACGPGASSPA